MTNTDAYLALGLMITLTVLGVYTLSLVWRFRQTRRTIETLELIANDEA